MLIGACSEIWVIKYDGWDTSTGVRGEINIAHELRKPIHYIELNELTHV